MKPGYFGNPRHRKDGEEQVDTPIGASCAICDEAIAIGDMGVVSPFGQVHHYACVMRAFVGSVGHQRRQCGCYGGRQEDPEGMTIREAAEAALEEYTMQQRR